MGKIGLYSNLTMIKTNVEAQNAEEVIRLLAKSALENNVINSSFVEAVLEREKDYPTGLPTAIPIAIPHIHDGCLKSFFAMAVLKEPVEFKCMGDPDEIVNAPLVFLFGITDPSYQTAVLRKFSTIFQDEDELKKLMELSDNGELLDKMHTLLGDYLVLEDER